MKHSNFDLLLGEVLVREQQELRMALNIFGDKYSWYDYEKQTWNCIGGGPTIQANLGTGIMDMHVLDVSIEEDDGIKMHCMETTTGKLFEFNWTFVIPGTLSRVIDFLPETKEIIDVGDGELLLFSKLELENIQEFSSIVLRVINGEYLDHFSAFKLAMDWAMEFSECERKNNWFKDSDDGEIWYDRVDRFIENKLVEWFDDCRSGINEWEIEVQDERFFGDDKLHIYDFKCDDGYAIGWLHDESDVVPKVIKMVYPKYSFVFASDELCNCVLKYRGLYDLDKKDICYADIMVALGEPKSIIYDV